MKKAILATKVGMTQIFNEDGTLTPVTVLQAGPCAVTQIKTVENDGYAKKPSAKAMEINQKIERNKKLLMNGMKEQMLGQMFIEKQRLVRFLAVEQFLNQEANMFLKYRYREELFGIRNTQIKRRYKKGGMRMFQQLYIQL